MDWLRRILGIRRAAEKPVQQAHRDSVRAPRTEPGPPSPPPIQRPAGGGPLQRQVDAWEEYVSQLLAAETCNLDPIHEANAIAHELVGVLVDRNLNGKQAERERREDDAVRLYEANVADEFMGSHPYERLLIIYSRTGRPEDAARVAQACLRHVRMGEGDKLRARCLKALGTP